MGLHPTPSTRNPFPKHFRPLVRDAQKPTLFDKIESTHTPTLLLPEVKMRFTIGLGSVACAVSQVAAHGFVPTIRVDGVEYPGWDINLDPYANPIVRSSPYCELRYGASYRPVAFACCP